MRRDEVRRQPRLKHTRWAWIKYQRRWSDRQIVQFYNLSRPRRKTARAWRLKESLRDISATAQSPEQANSLLDRWYSWARRCRLAPTKRLVGTLNSIFRACSMPSSLT